MYGAGFTASNAIASVDIRNLVIGDRPVATRGSVPMEFATIGSALSSRRKSLNIGQARAAEIIGMSRTTFSSYEHDLQRPSAEVLPSLAEFLEISIDDVLTLYGGTCIAALRPSLERVLAAHDGATVHFSEEDVKATISAPTSIAPEREPVPLHEPVNDEDPVVHATREASVSIFAHELSDDTSRPLPSTSPDRGQAEVKSPKGKGGKKKKGKKGKRAKA